MLTQMGIGAVLILATTTIHGIFTTAGLNLLTRHLRGRPEPAPQHHRTLLVSLFVLWMFLATVIEIWLWSMIYLFGGALESAEEAVYFSAVTMTTLGFGDIVLDQSWRLLSSFEAANGLFLFGWSTALVFAVVQWLYGHSLEQGRVGQ